ncbi:SMI1/KNR4 family protein [Eubacterium ventriosum]|uniref:SMI1/KNR4 family protein n=1 Tax=Eubacterium ventriosum TaxID=39496 RepID=UPI001C01756F|nr:SMI1/KNR4 family protein [Eubacterium ventriosum]MBT9699493.1 SMI1/KNR4 family protein [Eubacterium ventriosum]
MELFDEGIKLTKEDISKYEKKMNTKFPEAYVNFLLESNGGTPEEDLAFDFIDIASNKKNSTDIREFYIFYPEGESSYDDIIKVNYIMKSEGLVPEECLVSIFFCDHELENANNGYLLMSKVADSFNEFMEKLYIIE